MSHHEEYLPLKTRKLRLGADLVERAIILGELVKEILGPRNGAYETLPNDFDPRNEYIVGVLSPKSADTPRDVDADAELMNDGDSDEQESGEESLEPAIAGSPSLDPKSLPKSLGISFVAQITSGNILANVCFTWGRYISNGSEWHRKPFWFYKEFDITANHHWYDDDNTGVEFFVKSLKMTNDRYKISIFLVNNTPLGDQTKPTTADFIFQPEIRVNKLSGFEICSLDDEGISEDYSASEFDEEDSLKLLYRERTALARGHLVGVTWKSIDIQRDHPKLKDLAFPPFTWSDGCIVPEQIRNQFVTPDLRTDYTPTYPMEAPSMAWRDKYGPKPEFNPEVLSETWNPEELREKLIPLVSGYKNWFEEQKVTNSKLELSENLQRAAKKHFQLIEKAIDRMLRSIDLLCNDVDTRLAFCFANKVMALQSLWANKQVYRWRPFQLAFILLNIAAIADENDPDRGTADLLWFATGGGKTESYLGLAAFTIALQRRRARTDREGHKTGSGVNVLSRYTLRLLTIQQFRRALRVVTAAEFLRVDGLLKKGKKIGWRPSGCEVNSDFIWGGERISVGLWVGGGVTPNSLHSLTFPDQNGRFITIPGAFDLLKSKGKSGEGEPAQVLNCPCCNSFVAIPNEGLGPGTHTIHFLFKSTSTTPRLQTTDIVLGESTIADIKITKHGSVYYTASITFTIDQNQHVESDSIDDLWNSQIKGIIRNAELLAARPTRPGYFFQTFYTMQRREKEANFDIFCPNPRCELNSGSWAEKVPASVRSQFLSSSSDTEFQEVLDAFKVAGEPTVSSRIVIPAYTVDDQIYHRCPSMIIATADKFAQLPSEPKAAAIFGNVEYYHARWGYYREMCLPNYGGNMPATRAEHPPGFQRGQALHKKVEGFDPPQLIIQDELHLIEGPLGSLYGLYETIIDELCTKQSEHHRVSPKYVVSTATVRQAEKQVRSLFSRDFAQFPPAGIDVNDNFFSTSGEIHPLDSENAGRLYVGICAPGKGAQTPLVRIWSSLLQIAHEIKNAGVPSERIDGFLTVVGYFNALRELAGAASLFRQDIPERMSYVKGPNSRTLSENPLELSSRKSSTELPGLLELLGKDVDTGNPEDGVLATSMFGTGVDVDRLRLMIINGQPKSTSSYIQASGRVGRKRAGLVVAFFRASRPRDLDHYEFFTGYHRALYKYVEPVTVAPFSPRAREKAFGALSVALLRHAIRILGTKVSNQWRYQQRLQGQTTDSAAVNMKNLRHSQEVSRIIDLFAQRASRQPDGRRPEELTVISEIRSELDRWYTLAQTHTNLLYNESSMNRQPTHPVVLGDPQHYFQGLDVAYENAPQSLRDVEGTIIFKS